RCASGDAAYASHQFSAIGYASSSQSERNSTPRSISATSEAFFEATIPRGFSCRINVTPSGTCTGGFDPSSTTTIGNPRENFWCCSRVFCKTLGRLCVVIATPTRGFSSPTGAYFTPSISTLTVSSPPPLYYFIARENPLLPKQEGVSVCVLDARDDNAVLARRDEAEVARPHHATGDVTHAVVDGVVVERALERRDRRATDVLARVAVNTKLRLLVAREAEKLQHGTADRTRLREDDPLRTVKEVRLHD